MPGSARVPDPRHLRVKFAHPGRAHEPTRFVEMQIPQAKPWMVRLAPFQIELRTLRQPGTVRERALAALDELGVRAGDEFAMRDVYGHLGILMGTREYRAVQRAIDRMYRGDRGGRRNSSGCGWGGTGGRESIQVWG